MWCAIHRWRISHALDNKEELPVGVVAHVDACAGCREYYESVRAVCGRLTGEAEVDRGKMPADLHEGVMSGVRSVAERDAVQHAAEAQHQSKHGAGQARRSPGLVLMVPVAVAVVVVLGFVLLTRESGTGRRDPEAEDRSGEQIATRVGAYEQGVRNAVSEAGRVANAPLEEEIANLKRDLENTAQFLLGCLQLGEPASADG